LLVNLSEKEKIRLAIFDEQRRKDCQSFGQNRALLFCIDGFLREHGQDKKEVQGIMAVVGEGSFTSTRLAVTVANAFAYALQIPLLAVNKNQVDKAQDLIPKLLKQPKGRYISATYSGEPNIRIK